MLILEIIGKETIANVSVRANVAVSRYMLVEKYSGVAGGIFRLWSNKIIRLASHQAESRFNNNTKPKHKTINLRAVNVSTKGDADSQ